MAFEVRIEGLDDVTRKLRQLPRRNGKNAIRRALRKGANVIRDKVKARAKSIDDNETREAIWKNVAVASGGSRRERQVGGLLMRVGIRGGARLRRGQVSGLRGGNTTYWRFVEFGTSDTRAQPFMRPAMNSGASGAFSAFATAATQELDKEIAKLR